MCESSKNKVLLVVKIIHIHRQVNSLETQTNAKINSIFVLDSIKSIR